MSRGIDGKNLARFQEVFHTDGAPTFVLGCTLSLTAIADTATICAEAPFDLIVLEMAVACTVASAGATVQLRDDTVAISSAFPIAVANDTEKSGLAATNTLTAASRYIAKGSLIDVVVAGNVASGVVILHCCRR